MAEKPTRGGRKLQRNSPFTELVQMEGEGGAQVRSKHQSLLPQSSILGRSRSRDAGVRHRVPRSVYQAGHYDSFGKPRGSPLAKYHLPCGVHSPHAANAMFAELPTSLEAPAFSADTPALAASLEEGGLILFDLTAHDTAVAAAPEEIGRVGLLCFGPTNSFGDATLYGACKDGFLRRWIIRGFKDLIEIEAIPFNEDAVALFLSHSGRSVVAVGRGGLMLIASSLYADCAHYTRLKWPGGFTEGLASPGDSSANHHINSSSNGSSCSNGESGRDGRRYQTWRCHSRADGPHLRGPLEVDAEVADCVLLPDVLLHPRASDSADVFYVAVSSPSRGLMICSIILSEPEYTHQFAASILLTRHVPGRFWKLAVAKAPVPDCLLVQQHHNNQQTRGNVLLSLDSLASVELQCDCLPPLEEEGAAGKAGKANTEIVLLACLSPQSRFLTLIALIPNAVDYPGCDMHASVVELAPLGNTQANVRHGGSPAGPSCGPAGITAVAWVGGDEETENSSHTGNELVEDVTADDEAQLSRQRECCKNYKPLLCIGAPSSSVFVYEVTYYSPPGSNGAARKSRITASVPGAARSSQQQEQQMLQFRVRLVYRLDGNRGHSRLLKVPPSIVGGRRVLACTSGPHLLNLFEFSKTPNPDLFAVADEAITATQAGSGRAGEGEEDRAQKVTRGQQLASEAQKHAAASEAYIEYLKESFCAAAGAAAALGTPLAPPTGHAAPTDGVSNVHHNKGLEMQHLLHPSLRGAATAAEGLLQQDKVLKKHIEQITADLQACTLSNQSLQRMPEQPQQNLGGSATRPPWNNRFFVKGSEFDHFFS
ncbi:hypothetical protein Esti_002339 [Eimeria stiedai]